MRWRRGVLSLISVALLATSLVTGPASTPAAGVGDPYGADPLRLVPFADTVQQVYTQGTDSWEVWICRVPNWSVSINLNSVVDGLNSVVSPYFDWLSEGDYQTSFVAGGEVSSADSVSPDPDAVETFSASGCESAVAGASGGGSNGVLIVVAGGFAEGYGTAGAVCPEAPFTGCLTTYPANVRTAVVGAATVQAISPYTEPQWPAVIHEIGHTLNWPHSYTGNNLLPSGLANPYDNPMDLMSAAVKSAIPVGTVAYNRYAAGWMPSTDVEFYPGGTRQFDLAAFGTNGTQMLVIPGEAEGHFYTASLRIRSGYDAGIAMAGVELYEVDHRGTACNRPDRWPPTWPCFATLTRITPRPAGFDAIPTDHVLGAGETAIVGSYSVRVVSAGLTLNRIEVVDVVSGRFVDDNGNIHEANIETLAELGITQGCNPPANDKYCPALSVTRGEMAAFLLRAIGEEGNLPNYQGYFPDVPAGQWFTPYVERLFELGITGGFTDGTYRPFASVSRSEMAAFLIRAFDLEGSLASPAGFFTDIVPGAWYEPHAELLYTLEITTGCALDPLRYCPADPVRRDQMASFLVRALDA